MKKRTLAVLFLSSNILNTIGVCLPLSQPAGQPSLHVRQLQMHYDRLKRCNRWYLSNLYYSIKPTVKNVCTALRNIPSTMLHLIINHHTHEQQDAYVRFTDKDELGPEEKLYLIQRTSRTHEGLERFLEAVIDKEKQPRIALCFSGGGIRSTLLTLGFLIAAQDAGLLDCATYISGLSGSTWIMAPWLAAKKDLHNLRDTFGEKLKHGIHHLVHHRDREQVIKQLLTKAWYGQFICAMDIYGPLLANTLLDDLGGRKLSANLSDSHEHIIQGRYPMPIYTCISTNKDPYEWFEFTPFEVGSSYIGAYIPTWAYGRKFKSGRSVNHAPEQSLGYCMGIFGSAFEVDIEDVIRLSADSIQGLKDDLPDITHGVFDTIIEKLVNSPLDDVRLSPSMLPNFVYKTQTSSFTEHKKLSLVDAGIDFNLPFPPLLRAAREVDIIVVYDSSAGNIGSELKRAAKYAKRKGIKFPPVPDTVGQELCTILQDLNDPECPIVVYMPRIKNEAYSTSFDPTICTEDDYCNTFNFKYTQEQVNELTGLSELSCHQYIDAIKQVISHVIGVKQ